MSPKKQPAPPEPLKPPSSFEVFAVAPRLSLGVFSFWKSRQLAENESARLGAEITVVLPITVWADPEAFKVQS